MIKKNYNNLFILVFKTATAAAAAAAGHLGVLSIIPSLHPTLFISLKKNTQSKEIYFANLAKAIK